MRELTVAEYRTILTILSNPRGTERERIQRSGLPSSTYNVVRRRAFGEGWLSDVMVPNPGPCGFSGVELDLTRPSLSARDALVGSWASDPDCVLLWSGVHAVFGVFFRRGSESERGSLKSPADAPAIFRVFVGRRSGSVPAYFDYSGLWARFGGAPPPQGYPIGLDPGSDPADHRAVSVALRLQGEEDGSGPRTPRWTNFLRLPRARRRALERGILQPRTIPNVSRLPPYDERRIGEVILVQGRLRPGATASGLLSVLTGECGVYPFLLAEAQGNLILAGLGQMSSKGPGRVLVPSARRPVMAALTEQLDPADVLIEPIEAIEERVRHRYPTRLGRPTSGNGSAEGTSRDPR